MNDRFLAGSVLVGVGSVCLVALASAVATLFALDRAVVVAAGGLAGSLDLSWVAHCAACTGKGMDGAGAAAGSGGAGASGAGSSGGSDDDPVLPHEEGYLTEGDVPMEDVFEFEQDGPGGRSGPGDSGGGGEGTHPDIDEEGPDSWGIWESLGLDAGEAAAEEVAEGAGRRAASKGVGKGATSAAGAAWTAVNGSNALAKGIHAIEEGEGKFGGASASGRAGLDAAASETGAEPSTVGNDDVSGAADAYESGGDGQ